MTAIPVVVGGHHRGRGMLEMGHTRWRLPGRTGHFRAGFAMSVGSPICGLPEVYRPRILRPITYIHFHFFRVGYTMWWTVHSSNSRKTIRQRIVPTYPGAAYWLPQPELGELGGIFGHIYLAAQTRCKYVELSGRDMYHFVKSWCESFQDIVEFLTRQHFSLTS